MKKTHLITLTGRLLLAVSVGVVLAIGTGSSVRGQSTKWGLRSEAMGKDGMVASAHPLASVAGVKMLAKGGNAVDAIVAAAAALSVVEPSSSGVGGVGFMLLYSAQENRVRALPFGGRAPAAARLEAFTSESDPRGATTTGPKAPLVPGNLAGWAKALKDYGTMPLSEVLQPAIEYAEQGVIVDRRYAASLARRASDHARYPSSASIYLKNGEEPYKEGELLVNKAQARSLRIIAEKGIDAFYKGELAQEFVRAFERDGGLMRLSDLAAFPDSVQWQEPLSITYRGYTIYVAPPPNSGIQQLQTLKVMEGFDVKRMGHNTPEYLMHLMETIRLNRVDTDRYVADPRFVSVPVDRLLSDDYIAKRHAEVLAQVRSTSSAAVGSLRHVPVPSAEDLLNESTTHLTAVDRWGNGVNITQTLGGSSAYIPGDTGLLFNNASRWFNLTPGHPNVIAPNKDVEWCISPMQVHKDGQPYFVGGSPGSYGILQTVPQIVINLLDFDMNVQDAIGAPRFRWNDDVDAKLPAESVAMETRIPGEVVKALQSRGYDIDLVGDWSTRVGGAQGIVIDRASGWLRGGADPRRNGAAMGW